MNDFPTPTRISTPHATASEVIKVHSRSFYWASRLLPATVRADVVQLYAWCRWCDDMVDQAPSRQAAVRRLTEIREDLRRIEKGQAPLLRGSRWLADVAGRHRLPFNRCHDLLAGMDMDASGVRIRTEDELLLYCYRAAGSVGLMLCPILGTHDSRAFKAAKALGIAMQLTNIARDMGEDLQMGRCYIPEQWRQCPTQPLSPFEAKQHASKLLRIAERHYRIGFAGLAFLPRQVRLSIRSAGNIYREIGRLIERRQLNPLQTRAFVPAMHKAQIVARCYLEELTATLSRRLSQLSCSYFFLPLFDKDSTMKTDTHYLASLGLSLTLIMATALFLLVASHPKDAAYSLLPWIYAVISGVAAAGFSLLAKSYEKQLEQNAVAQPASTHRSTATRLGNQRQFD